MIKSETFSQQLSKLKLHRNILATLVQYFIYHLNLYRFSALEWRKLIGAGEISGHLYSTVQPAYFWRGKVSKPGYQTSSNRFLLRFPPLALLLSSSIEDDVNKNKNIRLASLLWLEFFSKKCHHSNVYDRICVLTSTSDPDEWGKQKQKEQHVSVYNTGGQ